MKDLFKTLAKALIGGVIGLIVCEMAGGDADTAFIAFAGIIFGWKFANGILGSCVSLNIGFSLLLLAVKLVLAMLVGWIVMFYEIVKGIVYTVMEIRTRVMAK